MAHGLYECCFVIHVILVRDPVLSLFHSLVVPEESTPHRARIRFRRVGFRIFKHFHTIFGHMSRAPSLDISCPLYLQFLAVPLNVPRNNCRRDVRSAELALFRMLVYAEVAFTGVA